MGEVGDTSQQVNLTRTDGGCEWRLSVMHWRQCWCIDSHGEWVLCVDEFSVLYYFDQSGTPPWPWHIYPFRHFDTGGHNPWQINKLGQILDFLPLIYPFWEVFGPKDLTQFFCDPWHRPNFDMAQMAVTRDCQIDWNSTVHELAVWWPWETRNLWDTLHIQNDFYLEHSVLPWLPPLKGRICLKVCLLWLKSVLVW